MAGLCRWATQGANTYTASAPRDATASRKARFLDERLRELIASVRCAATRWSGRRGMTNWAKASEVPGLMPARHVPSGACAAAGSGAPIGPLSLDVGVWAPFWRDDPGVFELAVIPLPWIAPIFIRWFVERIQLPGGWRLGFVGKAEDIWCGSSFSTRCARWQAWPTAPAASSDSAAGFLALLIVRWFCTNLTLGGANGAVTIHWRILADAGMELPLPLSVITIIGWALAATA